MTDEEMLQSEIAVSVETADNIERIVGPLSDEQKYRILAEVVSTLVATATVRKRWGLDPAPETYNADLMAIVENWIEENKEPQS